MRLRRILATIPLVAIGGLAGATSRFVLGAVAGDGLLITLAVNTAGSLFLGLLLFGVRSDRGIPMHLRYLLGTGFFASFTTYSTFVADIALHAPVIAGGYLFGSYVSGFAAIIASRAVVDRIRRGDRV